MKKAILLGLTIISGLISQAQTRIIERTIVYETQWQVPPQAAQMAAMLPKELTTIFKGDSSVTISSSQMATSKMILNPSKEYQRLLLEIPMMDKRISVLFTPADQEQMKEQEPEFECTATAETKKILGYTATKYVIKEKKKGETFEAWFTKDLNVVQNSLNKYFDKSLGFPLQFVTFQNSVQLTATVKSIKQDKIAAGSFSASKDYENLTFEELKAMMPRR